MQRNILSIIAACASLFTQAQAYHYPNGSTVANFTVTDVNGVNYELYDLTGEDKYVLLDFFTLACVPCQQTAPYFAELYQTYGCNSADVVCISLDFNADDAASINAYSDAYCGAWAHPPVVSNALALSDVFGVGNAPNYCLIGPDNVMINNYIWTVTDMATFLAAFPSGSGIVPHSCAVGTMEIHKPAQPMLFPNPAHDVIVVQDVDTRSYRILSSVGQVLLAGHLMGQRIDMTTLAPGRYVLELARASGVQRACVIKE